jgi:hypothetical protein
MTYTQLREAIAAMLEQTTSAFVSNGVDLLDAAINNAKNWAQSRYDFEYARTVVVVSVDPTTGGDLATALEYGTSRAVRVKKIEGAYLSYQGDTNRPVRFISKKGQSADAGRRYEGLPYAPSVASPLTAGSGNGGGATTVPMVVQQGGRIFLYPNSASLFSGAATNIYLDVVEWLPDFAQLSNAVAADGSEGNGTYTYLSGVYNNKAFYLQIPDNYILWYDSDNGRWLVTVVSDLGDTSPTNYYAMVTTSDSPAGAYMGAGAMTGTMNITVSAAITVSSFLLTYGAEFLMWKAIVEGNYIFEQFVFRQEGALPPPEKQAEAAFRALLDWDAGIVGSNTAEMDME